MREDPIFDLCDGGESRNTKVPGRRLGGVALSRNICGCGGGWDPDYRHMPASSESGRETRRKPSAHWLAEELAEAGG